MKLKDCFLTHKSMGEFFVVPTSKATFKGIIKNNETADYIVECLKSDTSIENIINQICEKYINTNKEEVTKDVIEIIEKLRSIDAIDD